MSVKTFIHAIRTNNLWLVKAHFKSGKFSEHDYRQSLVLASMWGRHEIVKYISRLGLGFMDLESAVNAACAKGQTHSVKILETEGADLHAEEDFSLYVAATRINKSTSAFLLLNEPGFDNVEYALKTVFKRGHRDFSMDCLSFHGNAKNPDKALEWAVKKRKTDFALGALDAGANANQGNAELLIRSIYEGQNDMIELLSARGADILARGEHVVLDAVKKCGKMDTTKLVYEKVKWAKSNPVVLLPGEGLPQGLKTVGPA